eukprot:1710869-Amphidinium_carterae.1
MASVSCSTYAARRRWNRRQFARKVFDCKTRVKRYVSVPVGRVLDVVLCSGVVRCPVIQIIFTRVPAPDLKQASSTAPART